MGSVDRNVIRDRYFFLARVAPRMGSVDRNVDRRCGISGPEVAPRMGSVDRNANAALLVPGAASRSPHGERG